MLPTNWWDDLPEIDAPPSTYAQDIEDQTRRLMAVALCVRDDAPGVRFPDRAAALDYLSQGDDVAIDQAAIDAWLDSHSAADVFPHTEE